MKYLALTTLLLAGQAAAWNNGYSTEAYNITPTTPWGTYDITGQRGGYRVETQRHPLGSTTTITPTTPWGTYDLTGKYGNRGYKIERRNW